MLTKDDLVQIKKVVKDEVAPAEEKVSNLEKDMRSVKSDVGTLKKDVSTLKSDVGTLKKDVSTLKRDMAETRNDIKTLIAYFDRDYVNLRIRIDRIEEHLGISDKN
jgi:peptidoglycan hydrolase CwlO-like protein